MNKTDCRLKLFRYFLLTGNRLALAFAGARVVFGTLATHGQALAVTQAAVAANVHQALDVGGDFRAQDAFGFVFGADDGPDFGEFIVRPILGLLVDVDASLIQNLGGVAPANAENVSQGDFAALVVRDVYPCDTSHLVWFCVCGRKPERQLEGEQQTATPYPAAPGILKKLN